MNTDTLIESVQSGFRVAVGATASFIEMLQDPQKQPENFNPWNSADWNELTKEWEEKGEKTELEARNFVETMWNQPDGSDSNSPATDRPTETIEVDSTTPSDPEAQSELHELTQQIASLRAELEKLQEENGDG